MLKARRLHGWSPGSVVLCADGRKARYRQEAKPILAGIRLHDLIDVKDSVGKWESAVVVAETDDRVKVHYVDWDVRYDEWVTKKSDRIATHRMHTVGPAGQLFFEDYAGKTKTKY